MPIWCNHQVYNLKKYLFTFLIYKTIDLFFLFDYFHILFLDSLRQLLIHWWHSTNLDVGLQLLTDKPLRTCHYVFPTLPRIQNSIDYLTLPFMLFPGRESVLEHFVHNVQCRGMFSTHYHRLAVDYQEDPKVCLVYLFLNKNL